MDLLRAILERLDDLQMDEELEEENFKQIEQNGGIVTGPDTDC